MEKEISGGPNPKLGCNKAFWSSVELEKESKLNIDGELNLITSF